VCVCVCVCVCEHKRKRNREIEVNLLPREDATNSTLLNPQERELMRQREQEVLAEAL
jgi:hypothetical protein